MSEAHEPEPEANRDGGEAAPRPRYSRLAIAAFVVVVLGFVPVPVAIAFSSLLSLGFAMLLWAVGLGLAIGAIADIRKSGGRYRGYALASLAAVLSGLPLLHLSISPPGCPDPHWQRIASTMNLEQLSRAALSYASDHDGQFPPAASWLEALQSEDYLLPTNELVNDPRDPDAGRMVAMNAALAGRRIDQIPDRKRTVLLFECRPGALLAGGPELLPAEPRYRGGYVIAFLSGHTECVPREEVGDLVWEPPSP